MGDNENAGKSLGDRVAEIGTTLGVVANVAGFVTSPLPSAAIQAAVDPDTTIVEVLESRPEGLQDYVDSVEEDGKAWIADRTVEANREAIDQAIEEGADRALEAADDGVEPEGATDLDGDGIVDASAEGDGIGESAASDGDGIGDAFDSDGDGIVDASPEADGTADGGDGFGDAADGDGGDGGDGGGGGW